MNILYFLILGITLCIGVILGSYFTTSDTVERSSPGNHINESQIKVYSSKIILDIPNATWSYFTDTNSMDPFLDEGANGIEIVPKNISEIQVGDIISYTDITNDTVIHRIVYINNDSTGTYFMAKGDNNVDIDSEKIRFSQIRGILVGIIY